MLGIEFLWDKAGWDSLGKVVLHFVHAGSLSLVGELWGEVSKVVLSFASNLRGGKGLGLGKLRTETVAQRLLDFEL
jgi:hypothetical protein